MMTNTHRWFLTLLAAVWLVCTAGAAAGATQAFTADGLPALPDGAEIKTVGAHNNTLIAVDRSGRVYRLPASGHAWEPAGDIGYELTPDHRLISLNTPRGVVVIDNVVIDATQLSFQTFPPRLIILNDDGLSVTKTDLPHPRQDPYMITAAVGETLYAFHVIALTGDRDKPFHYACQTLDLSNPKAGWQLATDLDLVAPWMRDDSVFAFGDTLYLFGFGADGETVGYQASTKPADRGKGWRRASGPPAWSSAATAAPFGDAHLFVMLGRDGQQQTNNTLLAYHTITDRWVEVALPEALGDGVALLTSRGGVPVAVAGSSVVALTPRATPPSFGWLDRGVVLIYLAGMVGIGLWFTRRERSASDFFRGGQRVPWWASGMSLFATYASAITIMSMPAMSYSSNWTYYAIGLCEIAALPIAVFFLVPLIRRLKISTSNEYLERRFGLTTRLIGSVIFMLMQIGARMASVMLLPAIALSAITGVDIVVCILVMGVIATLYTFLGGLEAVVWTDTVQGFVMVGTVVACLGLVFYKLNTPPGQALDALADAGKLHLFETSWSLAYPTLWIFLVYSMTMVMLRLSDQNFVQRVQCTPTMKQAKLAVCTQLLVALPLNALLFGVGTALWLFYRDRPDALDPTIKTDSIYPFFAAQQMPAGISGLIVAALLAATMSTISSSICSVSDLGVNDFFKRFRRNAPDQQALRLGRVLTAVIGLAGMGAAVLLSQLSADQIWDVFILVTNIIANGIVGLFLLGLLSKRANEAGAITGFACAMAAVIYLQWTKQPISGFLYLFIGSAITFTVGYFVSLIVPHEPRPLAGLTVYTLHESAEPATTDAAA